MSTFIGAVAVALVVAWLTYLAFIYRASRAAVGRPVTDLAERFPGLDDEATPAILYFYSEHCPPCRQTTPTIDALAAERRSVFKVNVNDAAALAQQLGVRVTPTLMVVRHRHVARVMIGAKPRAVIERALDFE